MRLSPSSWGCFSFATFLFPLAGRKWSRTEHQVPGLARFAAGHVALMVDKEGGVEVGAVVLVQPVGDGAIFPELEFAPAHVPGYDVCLGERWRDVCGEEDEGEDKG